MSDRTLRIFQTVKDSEDRLTEKPAVPWVPDDQGIETPLINVHPDVTFQTIEGFGGAFTEAGAVTLDRMSAGRRAEILNAYFNPDTGIGYSLCRTHINSCDFSTGNYAYVDDPRDTELRTFSVSRDEQSLIPFIRDAAKVNGADFKLFASPWSPPAWMKTNGQMNRGGKLKKECEAVWAKYYVKYVEAYAQRGIAIWGLSVQNEPKAAQSWDSCLYTADEEKDFVKNHLGPALERAGMRHVKIIIWDHNKERVFERAKAAFSDPAASRYIWGVGFHWYSGDHFEALAITQKAFPDKHLLFTEGCQEGGVKLGSWHTAERYGHDMIGNLTHGAVGFVDWNLVLDERGGPNHVGNFCDAPIIADTRTDAVIYESSLYYLGHFSRFIRPGAVRIGHSRYTDKLEVCAFRNLDGGLVVIVLNRTDATLPFTLRCESAGIVPLQSQPHSLMSLLY